MLGSDVYKRQDTSRTPVETTVDRVAGIVAERHEIDIPLSVVHANLATVVRRPEIAAFARRRTIIPVDAKIGA